MKIKHALLRSQVRQVLLERMFKGELRNGESVNDMALAKELGISRTPLREALIELARDGLIEAVARRGFVVREITNEEYDDITSMLGALEPMALLRTNSSLYGSVPELRRLMREARETIDDPEAQFRLDDEWHNLLLSHCGSRRFRETILPIRDQSKRFSYAFVHLLPPSTIGIGEHEAVNEALARHDIEGAADRLSDHWRSCLERFKCTGGLGTPAAEGPPA